VNYQWAAGSHRGRVRNNNEDAYAPETSGHGRAPLVVMVADGMGGAAGGEVASQLAVEQASKSTGTVIDRVIRANNAVFERSVTDPALAGMGTTLTLIEFGDDGMARVGHVGDSRAYLWRGDNLEQLTNDHTVVAEQIAAGRIRPVDAANHPQRSMLTRVLGIGPEIETDEMELPVHPGDRFLLCSDGLTAMLADDRIASLLEGGSPEEVVWSLIEGANRAGGHDNVTVVVVDVEP
jgi:protein phosphatase